MDVPSARGALGLHVPVSWEDVRAAYRSRISAAHPDRAGGDAEQAVTLNRAYATLLRARREGRLNEPSPPVTPTVPVRPDAEPPGAPPEVLDGDTVRIHLPPDEAFLRLLEAAHQIGDVTYVDRSCAIFEALVSVAGEGACSFVVTLQGRGEATDAFCTLEAIEHVASPPVRHVVEALVAAL
ncbi:MAG: J domain-containing protein [Acidimicrobiales bacterium]